MKKLKNLLILTLTALMLISCAQDDVESSSSEKATKFEAGWWKYTTKSSSVTQTFYFEFDEDKNIIRAGKPEEEIKGAELEAYKTNPSFTWDVLVKACIKTDTTETTFVKCNAPEWSDITYTLYEYPKFLLIPISVTYDVKIGDKIKFIHDCYIPIQGGGGFDWRHPFTFENKYLLKEEDIHWEGEDNPKWNYQDYYLWTALAEGTALIKFPVENGEQPTITINITK